MPLFCPSHGVLAEILVLLLTTLKRRCGCPPSATRYSPRRLRHDAYPELCLGPSCCRKTKVPLVLSLLWRAWQSKISVVSQLGRATASFSCQYLFFFLASVFSPCVQNTIHCRLSMLTSCPRALPTHGNASPTPMPACGLWSLECYTMGMEEAPDATPLIEEPGARREQCFEPASRARRLCHACSDNSGVPFVRVERGEARKMKTAGSPGHMGHFLSRVSQPR